MKSRLLALSLILLGVGALFGAVFARSVFGTVERPLAGRAVRTIEERFDGETGRRSIVIELPRLPDLPDVPRMPDRPELRWGQRVESGFFFDNRAGLFVFGLVRGIISWVIRLFATLLILLGVVIVVRRRQRPEEKVPPKIIDDASASQA